MPNKALDFSNSVLKAWTKYLGKIEHNSSAAVLTLSDYYH